MIGGPPYPVGSGDGNGTIPLNEVTFVQTAEDVLSAADGAATLPLWSLGLLGGATGLTFGLLGYVQAYPGFDRIRSRASAVRSCRC